MKLGVFGGTFDPVHVGHLVVAEQAQDQLALDEVVFVPAGQPWLKAGTHVSEGHHRLAMVERAIAGNPRFRASDIELRRPGPTYTVDTLEALTKNGGSRELYLIVGADALAEMHRWQAPSRVLELASLAIVHRPGAREIDAVGLDRMLPGAWRRASVVNASLIEVSGTDIRRRVSERKPITYLVPEGVQEYIRRNGLYS